MEVITKVYDKCLLEIERKLYRDGEPIACAIHDSFGSFANSTHNCLGCNFADATDRIKIAIQRNIRSPETEDYNFEQYLFSLYLFVERVNVVFDVIKLEEGNRKRHFEIFYKIKRWANFYKHPNYFLFVHHPTYLTSESEIDVDSYDLLIDSEFIYNHWREGKSKSAKIKNDIQNKQRIAIIYPDLIQLTEEFCEAAEEFFEIPQNNKIYREMLNDVSTLQGYFSDEHGET